MNDLSANSPVVRIKFGEPRSQPENFVAPNPKTEPKWPLRKWLLIIALILMAHVAAIFIFGEYKFAAPRAIANVPHFQLANNSSELVALDDPTLFVLPRMGNSKLLKMPNVKPVPFRWSENPHFLPLASETLGATFAQFMQTNAFEIFQPDFKPQPDLSAPAVLLEPLFAEKSTLQIEGDLAQRPLASKMDLPDLPYADVIAPSKVQALVDANGNVVSAILLPQNNFSRVDRSDAADQRALEIARSMRFAPSPQLTVGQIIFNWHTVPPATDFTAP